MQRMQDHIMEVYGVDNIAKAPEVKEKIAAELEKRGISVKKSLFDDFVIDNFLEEDIDDGTFIDDLPKDVKRLVFAKIGAMMIDYAGSEDFE